jgi:hypothetical protein
MNVTSKISRFPRPIREELNRRLDSAERNPAILAWLNSLPEVQAILIAEFEAKPVNRQNLNYWKKTGFAKWQLRQNALQFLAELNGDHTLDKSLTDSLSDKLAHWNAIRLAAAADAMAGVHEDPENEMRHLREFCNDINNLRRGDLSAGRLDLERKRLAILQTKSDEEKEAEFWQWTKRADIQAKLYPHRDPDKIRREVDRMISSRLMGIRYPDEPNGEPDPAAMI